MILWTPAWCWQYGDRDEWVHRRLAPACRIADEDRTGTRKVIMVVSLLSCAVFYPLWYLLSLQAVLVPYVKSDCQCGSRAPSQPCGAAVVVTNGIEPLRGVWYVFGGVRYRGWKGECRTLLEMVLQRQMHNNREDTLFSQSAQTWIGKKSQYLLL